MPSTIYEVVGREYINSVPIVQGYNAFQSKVFYSGMLILGLGVAYLYLTSKIPDGTEKPVIPGV